ncbi:SepM family pheromone-processing serine protease [Ligilactobacillus ceti]|uniref:ATP-dependent protease La n=1 Tax=Ligilactobacillus ceti DSM 22408 TaxID=1122146 RepID=A0A0R2KIA0_9LACO|nr:SepM family pheromone-processing serine protease [Ligilactobacillus ceti]KRN88923.1 ATP-dependent protease La [Ligilactobacillus ceti DSM 22408]
MTYKKIRNIFISIVVILSIVIVMLIPLPYYVEFPGAAKPVSNYIKVEQPTHQSGKTNEYLLVYVRVGRMTPLTYIMSKFEPQSQIIPAKKIVGNYSDDDKNNFDHYQMENSYETAKYVALTAAKRPVELQTKGLYVARIIPESKFKDKLKFGDVITEINGHKFTNLDDYLKSFAKMKIGDPITVTYLRDKKEYTATAKAIELRDNKTTQAGLGINFINKLQVVSKEKITADLNSLSGPSAGMIMALDIYNQLKPNAFKKQRIIGGTGTLNLDGTIGPIGGVDKKVVSCAKAKAEIFFVPEIKYSQQKMSNYEEAVKVVKQRNLKIKVVPVKNFQDVIEYLQNN